MERYQFQVAYMEEANKFIAGLSENVRNKILYNVRKIKNGVKDSDLFKKLEGTDIWELRTQYEGNQYRLLAFWDKDTKRLVVATHGFVKKTWKVPSKEIARAEALRKEYYATK